MYVEEHIYNLGLSIAIYCLYSCSYLPTTNLCTETNVRLENLCRKIEGEPKDENLYNLLDESVRKVQFRPQTRVKPELGCWFRRTNHLQESRLPARSLSTIIIYNKNNDTLGVSKSIP